MRRVSDLFWAQHPYPLIRLFAELGSLPHAWAAPKTGVWNEFNRELNTVANRIQSLDVTPEEGLLRPHGKDLTPAGRALFDLLYPGRRLDA